MNLQPLFPTPIVSVTQFPDTHPGQASFVWLVETESERAIVRTTRMSKEPADEFWHGCLSLFGIDPTDVFALEAVNESLRQTSLIPVPKVLRTDSLNGVPFAIVEVLPGQTVQSFSALPVSASYQLGKSIASIHQLQRVTCGNFRGTVRYPASEFHTKVAGVMPLLTARYHAEDTEITEALGGFVTAARTIPSPPTAVPVLLDLDPTQFIAADGALTGLVDTEVYAYGPAELDLIALEYLLDSPRAKAFQEGYKAVLPFPNLSAVRGLYRFLNRILSVQGPIPLQQWMNHPIRFNS
ncbi:phosphotransferase [Alicyclobacillus ferrooxydans]|uniref:Aminoglycoside phosphotransferase domain-containing protein n=1 Tax=Alicyclobacillus ferrooxydans TaxID=471514 RepID=A0A0P9CGJ9_9BACL|nr:phosphotransferase [Alicyclobacillus ferrooxydans]KPV42148.1 hypothetical protein AN477_19055 [Alicyclobacillus ferrooxydans]